MKHYARVTGGNAIEIECGDFTPGQAADAAVYAFVAGHLRPTRAGDYVIEVEARGGAWHTYVCHVTNVGQDGRLVMQVTRPPGIDR